MEYPCACSVVKSVRVRVCACVLCVRWCEFEVKITRKSYVAKQSSTTGFVAFSTTSEKLAVVTCTTEGEEEANER